jgi:hypothetical protein
MRRELEELMESEDLYLCSDLIRITADAAEQIGNLESIAPGGCTVSAPVSIAVGRRVAMQCVECPQGKSACLECQFGGVVRSVEEAGALGCAVKIEFRDRIWSPREWTPRHLGKFPLEQNSPEGR